MSGGQAPIQTSVVKVRVIRCSPGSWYENKVGHVVQAYKQLYGDGYVSYKQWPRPRGFEPSGDYVTDDLQGVEQ